MQCKAAGQNALIHLVLSCVMVVSLSACASLQRPVIAPEAIAQTNDTAFAQFRFPADKPPTFAGSFTTEGNNQDYTVLALSGGGADGAFGVGLLAGWAKSARRPNFDVVTGVSTGALIAPFAFLGSARDEHLRELYTGPHLAKLLKKGSAIRLLRGPSVYSSDALRSEIAKHVTDELVAAIATEHRNGRRLYVATSNLDAQQMLIWDLGMLAATGTSESKDLIRQILLAAVSIPLAFDPVAIRTVGDDNFLSEAHSDANIFAHYYAGDELFPIEECRALRRKCELYVVIHGKIIAEPETVKWSTLAIGRRVLQTLLKASLRTQLTVTEQSTRSNNIAFRFAYLDVPFPSASPVEFDASYMKRLYEIGKSQGERPEIWESEVPKVR
jgi:predicted patatin/cPLA2 family phospholipase